MNAPTPIARRTKAFDYGALPASDAADLRDRAERIRQHTRAAVVEVGRELLAAKTRVGHGCFQAWVKADCQLSLRTAERAIRVAEFVDKNDNLSFLPPDGLLALASPSAPEDTVVEILERIEAGQRPTTAEIKREIRAAKPQLGTSSADEKRVEAADLNEMTDPLRHSRAEKTESQPLEPREAEAGAAGPTGALERVATMLIEALDNRRIAELVPDLETITTAALAAALRERRPNLFSEGKEQPPRRAPETCPIVRAA